MKTTRMHRKQDGNIIALSVCVIGILVFTFAIFGLNMTRMIGSNQEQKTAIESAALAASIDLSKIVIEDDNLGFIGLSDAAPIGTGTKALDNRYLPVRGINTILGTIRLQMIIANQLDNAYMKQLALRDYDFAMSAKDRLNSTLSAAVMPGGQGYDKDGNVVTPWQDAVNAYQKNVIRMTGRKSILIADSLKLKLGVASAIPCNIFCPQPSTMAQVAADAQQAGLYKAYVNVPMNARNFVFACLEDSPILLDPAKFIATMPSLPYAIPTVVQCEADQQFDGNTHEGQSATYKVHAVACAVPGVLDIHGANAGSFVVSFPDGRPSNIIKPQDLFTNGGAAKSPADVLQTPLTNDFPPAVLTDTSLPFVGGHPAFEKVTALGMFDWLRGCGSGLNVQTFLDMLAAPFSGTGGALHRYTINKDSGIDYTVIPIGPNFVLPVSNDQYFARSKFAVADQTNIYDIFSRDFVFQPGRHLGGIHAGEPLPIDAFKTDGYVPPPGSLPLNNPNLDENVSIQFPSGSGIRDLSNSIAVEIRFRSR